MVEAAGWGCVEVEMEGSSRLEEASQTDEVTTVLSSALALALASLPRAQVDEVVSLVATDKPRAIATVARLIRGSRSKDAVAHLSDAGNQVDDPSLIFALGLAMAGVGGQRARRSAIELAQRLHPEDRIGLEWYALGITPLKVANRLNTVGSSAAGANANPSPNAGSPTPDDMEGSSRHFGSDDPDAGRIFNLAEIHERLNQAGVILSFPLASETYPAAHDDLFIRMVRLTRGVINVSGVSQVLPARQPSGKGSGTLRFIFGLKARSIPLEYEENELAGDRLVFCINQMFRGMSNKHRLIPLLAPPGMMSVIYGDPQRILKLMMEYRIPLDLERVKLWRRDGVITPDQDQSKDPA